MQLQQVIDGFERDILSGRARWIADLSETFRDYQITGHTFDMCARGQTRGKGFLLSRFFAWTVLPNYKVSLYARAVRDSANLLRGNLIELLQVIRKDMEKRDLKWAWLVLFFEAAPPSQIASLVESYNKNDIGIGTVNAYSGNVLVSNNLLGRSLSKHIGLDRLVSRLEHGKGRQGSGS
jgi:hypothetical protein